MYLIKSKEVICGKIWRQEREWDQRSNYIIVAKIIIKYLTCECAIFKVYFKLINLNLIIIRLNLIIKLIN